MESLYIKGGIYYKIMCMLQVVSSVAAAWRRFVIGMGFHDERLQAHVDSDLRPFGYAGDTLSIKWIFVIIRLCISADLRCVQTAFEGFVRGIAYPRSMLYRTEVKQE